MHFSTILIRFEKFWFPDSNSARKTHLGSTKIVQIGGPELVPVPLSLTYEVISEAPVAYASGFLVILVLSLVVVWEVVGIRSRKCDNPSCRGLRKAVEFDIQIESEESLKGFPPLIRDEFLMFELREDHKELENELRKLAPPNGRAVLIFRAKCGCPIGRMQAWGSKKPRRSKKQGTISGAKKLSVKR
ncbi:uncharacterized protein At5g19025 [Amborella trichopoda]|uniref:uncharacterized protein At5g19025 n=1 Tax=Amborella trichopoda TaxID=13333 RepID=UPI0005D35170|nr:uncharacterized protein At5g19025 [Amborella trichopoda]|eukprot:XP_006827280.2 uncharacterized protein At5g19025 [Amborella trichopoda]